MAKSVAGSQIHRLHAWWMYAAPWAWRCPECQTLIRGIDEAEARTRAKEHMKGHSR